EVERFDDCQEELLGIGENRSAELNAQMSIRSAYWNTEDRPALAARFKDKYVLPALSPVVRASLTGALPNVESQRTAFLAASLLLNDMLQDRVPWSRSTSEFAAKYFATYRSPSTAQIVNPLRNKAVAKIKATIANKTKEGAFVEVVMLYENL